jgi:methylase of polypeptide subunit release factors
MPPLPPHAGTSADRDRLLGLFDRAAFREPAILERLHLRDLDPLEGESRLAMAATFHDTDLLAILIRLFVLGGLVDAGLVAGAATDAELAVLRGTSLVEPFGEDAALYSPHQLVPVLAGDRSLWIASDRRDSPDGSMLPQFSDMVFSGHNMGTLQFLRLMPRTPSGAALDLCSGTGVIALVAAETARQVVAVDITDRSNAFARFNCWLNDGGAIDVRQGDLFDPVKGEQFDHIFAHPPYVPTRVDAAIYRDGGETGDKLLRRIVNGLPDHVRVGGTFQIVTIGMDTASAPFESRARQWLGDRERDFDLIFGMTSSMGPHQFAQKLATKASTSTPHEFEDWVELFKQLEVREVVYGALIGRRFSGSGEAQTRRVLAAGNAGPEGYAWMFDWFEWLRRPNRRERVLEARPTLVDGTHAHVDHVVREGTFSPETHRLENGKVPFHVEIVTDGWVVRLMTRFDGSHTAADVYAGAKADQEVPDQFQEEEFVDLVCFLAERGLLTLIGSRDK